MNSLNAALLEQYEWNDANRLTRHTNEARDVTTYRYDGDHNRVYMGTELGSLDAASSYPDGHPLGERTGWESQYKKEQTSIYFANDTTLNYVEPLMAMSEDKNWKQNFTYGALGERVSMSYLPSGDPSNDWEPTPGASGANSGNALTTLYYLSDVRGSAIGLMDPEGAIAARYHYDEFGIALDDEKFDMNWSGPDNLFGYTGLGYDYTSGLNNARARYFDASIGRFINEDTYEGELNNPLTLNLYTYVHNNPLMYIDPSGYIPTPLEAAYMAQHVHDAINDEINKKYLLGGWLLVDIIKNKEGMKIGVYRRGSKSNGITEYALVNKGTTTGGDWINNLQQPMGMSTDMVDSINYAVEFVNDKKGYEFTMIGHSKGGAEATSNALATNTNAITFNSATPSTPLYDLLDEGDKKRWNEYSATMVHYAVNGDALTGSMGTPAKFYGKAVYLPNQHPTNWLASGKTIVKNGIKNHSMKSVINALKEEGYN